MSPRFWPAWRTARRSAKENRRPSDERRRDLDPLQGQRARGAGGRPLAKSDVVLRQFRESAGGGGGPVARVRGAVRQREGDQGSYARPPRPLSRGLRSEGRRERRPG